MFKFKLTIVILILFSCNNDENVRDATVVESEKIAEFVFVTPNSQNENFNIPNSHKFQKHIKSGELLSDGNIMPKKMILQDTFQ